MISGTKHFVGREGVLLLASGEWWNKGDNRRKLHMVSDYNSVQS